jgi:hypothetical protein
MKTDGEDSSLNGMQGVRTRMDVVLNLDYGHEDENISRKEWGGILSSRDRLLFPSFRKHPR